MADEIKQSGTVPVVTPLNPSRGAGRRKRPPQQQPADERKPRDRRPDDDPPHQVDEYV